MTALPSTSTTTSSNLLMIPPYIHGEEVDKVDSFKVLGVHISADLTWTTKSPNRWGRPNRGLKQAHLPHHLMINFYSSAIKSILKYCCQVWFSTCTKENRTDLQWVVRVAERIINTSQPLLKDIYSSRLQKKTSCIVKASAHPGHHLFSLLPSGKRQRLIKNTSNRLKKRFYPQAVKSTTPSTQDWGLITPFKLR